MKYTSENMNYIFNVSYFDDIDWAAFWQQQRRK